METTLERIPYKEIALKVGRTTGNAYSISWNAREVAVLKVDEITEEHKKLGSLSHPNIIPLLGYSIRPSGKFCLVLPLYRVSLSQQLYSQHYSFESGMQWAQQVCDGLGALHDAGLLHLNLNLETVVFNQEGRPVLVDMDCLTPESVSPFVAPEILRGEKPSNRSDIYSFGRLLFCCAEQKKPHEVLSEKTPPKLAHLIKHCWEIKSDDRPASVQTVSELLQTALKL